MYCLLRQSRLLLSLLLICINLTSCTLLKPDNTANTATPVEPILIEPIVKKVDVSDSVAKQETISPENKNVQPNQVPVITTEPTFADIPPVGDLWVRIRNGFRLPDGLDSHPEAQRRIDVYRQRLTRSSRLIEHITDNAAPYLHFVVEELRKHDMPLEIALIPIVESRYDPFAYSPGRASGLWQFIPSTGTRFGLTQNWWLDERRDTIAATGAAIQYFIYLHKLFDGDWLLAMASYNAGQGNVLKAIRKNKKLGKPTDYWSLDLPKETQHYIPKILAWRDIIRAPENYNVVIHPIPDEPYFGIVNAGSQIDLAEVAALAEVDIDTIYQLNPAYNRWATDPQPPHDLLIPLDNVDTFTTALNELPMSQRMTWRRYIIQPGDTLSQIAEKFSTTPQLIASINGVSNSRIRAGKALLIPSATRKEEYYRLSAEQRLAKRQKTSPRKHAQKIVHRVATGESLWDISRRYKVNVKALARWNHMAPGDILSVGKKLVVWTQQPSAAITKREKRKLFYTVKQGDSLAQIANRFKVSISDIKSWNQSARQQYIQPGQLLTLYVALTDRELTAN